MRKILFIAGTRPEAIKIAPVYLEMKRRAAFEPILCSTGQHADLIAHGLAPFGITPDITLDTMREGQPLHQLAGSLFQQTGDAIAQVEPDVIMVQGDTVSAFAGGWCGFYQKIPVAHIEAGLRTGNLCHPFPEEATRRALTIVSQTHLAPTPGSRDNLLREGVTAEQIIVTGNTTIDALNIMVGNNYQPASSGESDGPRRILVTGHRRENFGAGLENLCRALLQIADEFPEVEITYAVHPNPAVREPVHRLLGKKENIHLVEPLNYREFVDRMAESTFIISDSGGVQEEAPALGKPVLITRTTTERPEAVERGANRLVGSETDAIVNAARELLTNAGVYFRMATTGCPYGDGKAAQRICDHLDGQAVKQFRAEES